MATDRGYLKFLYFFVIPSILGIFFVSIIGLSFAQEDENDEEEEDENKLIVRANVDLENVDLANTKFIRVIGFINGEEAKQDIPISSIDKSDNNLEVELKVNEENDIVEADTPDEFFVCAYQVGDLSQESNQITNFDCNEGDILGNPMEISVFKSDSQVYEKSQEVYQANLNTNSNSNNSDQVKIKISAPLSDKDDTEKLILGVMIKGQLQSEVIQDVEAELDKSDDETISKTFTFDRNTDIGQIQVGDRYHACVASEDLRPPEGSECEKRIIKNLEKVSGLFVR
jgi:hypothetical protein